MTSGETEVPRGTSQGRDEAVIRERFLRDQLGPGWPLRRRQAFRAAEEGNARRLRAFLEAGFKVNEIDRQTHATALHYAAASGARATARVLLQTGQCDFLKRDRQGRLASELALVYGHDAAMARLLRKREKEQAHEQGVKLRRRDPDHKPPRYNL